MCISGDAQIDRNAARSRSIYKHPLDGVEKSTPPTAYLVCPHHVRSHAGLDQYMLVRCKGRLSLGLPSHSPHTNTPSAAGRAASFAATNKVRHAHALTRPTLTLQGSCISPTRMRSRPGSPAASQGTPSEREIANITIALITHSFAAYTTRTWPPRCATTSLLCCARTSRSRPMPSSRSAARSSRSFLTMVSSLSSSPQYSSHTDTQTYSCAI